MKHMTILYWIHFIQQNVSLPKTAPLSKNQLEENILESCSLIYVFERLCRQTLNTLAKMFVAELAR